MSTNTETQTPRRSSWQIEITGGINAGATMPLDMGIHTIGGLLSNDIVLTEPDIAEQQVKIEIGPDGARATPLAAGMSRRRRDLPAGQTIALRPGTTLRVGQTNIRISGPFGRRRGMGWFAVPASVLCIAGTALGAFYLATPVAAVTNAAHSAPAPSKSGDTDTAQRELRNHLSGLGLNDSVTLASSNRVVTATGMLLPADRAVWLAAQQWFDGQFGSHTVLVDRVGIAAKQDLPKLDIAAISLLPIPHLITRDGEHYIEGAVLPGGWAISAITRNAVSLTRDGRSVVVAL